METIPNRHDTIWYQLAVIAQSDMCCSTTDIEVYSRRAKSEGDSFRTRCLADLGRALLTALNKGVWEEEISSVRFVRRKGSVLPLFLYDAWSKVFSDEGQVKADVLTEVAVGHLRQLTAVFSKLPKPHTNEQGEAVQTRFIANEQTILDLPHLRAEFGMLAFPTPRGDGIIRGWTILGQARKLIALVLAGSDPREITPRHGSGASACGTRPWERYSSFRYDPKIDKIWDYASFFHSGGCHLVDCLSALQDAESLPRQAQGCLVPKDYRGPRLISKEPRELTYVQQGLMNLLRQTLERHVKTRGFVNFTDQSINQQLAKIGSLHCAPGTSQTGYSTVSGEILGTTYKVRGANQNLATLDLKDASDLLRWDVVYHLFPNNWAEALDACRSTSTVLPNGTTVELRKHAPMGSSVCFPIMALTIWALIKAAYPYHPVWVYGDDVIVPSAIAGGTMEILNAIGLVVNSEKSFAGTTPFRESCGREYYNGSDVTPVKLGSTMERDLGAMSSYISFVNNITRKYGVYRNDEMIAFASALTNAPVIGMLGLELGGMPAQADWRDFAPSAHESVRAFVLAGPYYLADIRVVKRRWNRDFQRHEYRLRVSQGVDVKVDPNSWGYVLRALLVGGELGFDGRHALARRVRYKYSWVHLPDKQVK